MPVALNWEFYALYALIGLLAGLLGGLLGIGGGLIIVPALLYAFQAQQFVTGIQMHLAVATSLAAIVFTSASSALAHHRRGAVLWKPVGMLVPGILIGGATGAAMTGYLPDEVLRITFGIFECAVAWQVARGFAPASRRELPTFPLLSVAGGGIGAASAVLGIGGGTFIVPFLVWCNIDIRKAVATSSACGLPIALAGGGGMVLAGWDRPGLPELATGIVYWPAALAIACTSVFAAPIGAWLAHTLPVAALR
ncbi:MAG: sulfite exporter TauE/SafE family protein, partial [Gammaproteobacteria bacterium]